jgi:hypothetical protein
MHIGQSSNYNRGVLNFFRERPIHGGTSLGTGHCLVHTPDNLVYRRLMR